MAIYRNYIPSSPCSLPIPSFYVSRLQQIHLLSSSFSISSIQEDHSRSHRFLRSPRKQPNPRCSQTRFTTGARWATPNRIPQALAHHIRGPQIRDPQQSPWRLRQGQARNCRRERNAYRRQRDGRGLYQSRRQWLFRRPGRMGWS